MYLVLRYSTKSFDRNKHWKYPAQRINFKLNLCFCFPPTKQFLHVFIPFYILWTTPGSIPFTRQRESVLKYLHINFHHKKQHRNHEFPGHFSCTTTTPYSALVVTIACIHICIRYILLAVLSKSQKFVYVNE